MKRNLLVLAIFFSISLFAFSQFRWDVGFNMGASNYLGEMGGKEDTRKDFVADLKLSQTKFTCGGFVRYKITPSFFLKSNFQYARLSGDDKLCTNPGRNGRNLSFRNDIFELSINSEFTFFYQNDIGGRGGSAMTCDPMYLQGWPASCIIQKHFITDSGWNFGR